MEPESLGLLFVAILILWAIIFFIRIPIIIAKTGRITGSGLTTIGLLSRSGLLIGLTWLIALVLSWVWKPSNQFEKHPRIGTQNTFCPALALPHVPTRKNPMLSAPAAGS
jgi:hypothetical protein